MTTSTAPTRSSRMPTLVAALAAAALCVALVAGAWQLGAAMRPAPADAAIERQAAYQQSYDDAHADAAQAAYLDAWDPAFQRGAAEGTRDGAAAGAASITAAP